MSNMDYDFSEEKTVDPKLYKATLCQFYLKGPCKNGDKCSYAHVSGLVHVVTF